MGTRAAQAPPPLPSTSPAPTKDTSDPSCRGGGGVDEGWGRLRRPRPSPTPDTKPHHYHPAQTPTDSRRISRATLPEAQILALKSRAINSNWDTCYAAVCLHLISLLSTWLTSEGQIAGNNAEIFPLLPWDAGWLAKFRQSVTARLEHVERQADVGTRFIASAPHVPTGIAETLDLAQIFALSVFRDAVGLELINRLDAYASEMLGRPIEDVFSRYSPFWEFCRSIFQEWYLGDELFAQTYGHAPAQAGKPGCIHFERPCCPSNTYARRLRH